MTKRFAVVISHPIQYFAPLHREIARRSDVDLRVFFCCDWGVEEYVDPGFGIALKWDTPLLDGYEHEFLPIARRPRSLGFWEVDNPSVGEALGRYDPDIVQVCGYARRTNWRVAAWARRWQKPVLYASDSNANTPRPLWKRVAKQAIVRRFYNRMAGALYASESNRDYHRMYGMPEDRMFHAAFAVDGQRMMSSVGDPERTRREVRSQHAIPNDAFVVLFVGKYVEHKRPLDLVRALGRLGRQAPVYGLFVGEGPQRSMLEQYFEQEGVRNCVLTGFVNQSQIGRYYASADIVVLPSSLEAHGLVLGEGAVFGLPMVASDQVGCVGDTSIARPGRNALIYRCGQVDELEAAIRRLYEDDQLRQRMAAESRAVAEAHDVRASAGDLAGAIHKLVAMGRR